MSGVYHRPKLSTQIPAQGQTLIEIFDQDHVWSLMYAKILDPDPSQELKQVKIFDLHHVRGLTPA